MAISSPMAPCSHDPMAVSSLSPDASKVRSCQILEQREIMREIGSCLMDSCLMDSCLSDCPGQLNVGQLTAYGRPAVDLPHAQTAHANVADGH